KEQKRPVGRPPSDDPKKEHIRIRVTEQEKKMLKGTKMSSLINTGLKIVMPTLGVYIEDENRWVDYKESGTDANLIVYNSICLAIDIIK
ncbi:hypothetical protein, partial [Listeria monocytogenes]|uniref:hypothetical protein n=1 Tax=Listeria monocytogenes TaxID=1639 RepID=UPI002FDC345D